VAGEFKAELTFGPCAQLPYIDFRPGKQISRFSTEEFTADLMMLTHRSFENDDGPTLPRKLDRKSRTGKASADNNRGRFGHPAIQRAHNRSAAGSSPH
jgi:hypothetical protein